ncbi:carboxypeptidase regulatory-like domain-containing protein [Acidipila sp. EB88]|nr:carboxypeptidase regulatory-like domain-containing protein [Acidipila sp. EB88]
MVRASNGKPVENAAVIFHTFHEGKDQGNMEVKTNEDGKAVLDVIPIGDEVQVQVFKAGYQTYGESFTNDLAARDLEIKVKPPTGQYSIYQKGPLEGNAQQSVTPQPTQSSAKTTKTPN